MFSKKSFLLILALVVSVSLIWAQPHPGKEGKMKMDQGCMEEREMGWKSMQESLNLSEEQAMQIHDFRFAFREKKMNLDNQIEAKHLELEKEEFGKNPETVNMSKVLKLHQDISALRLEILEERMKMQKQVFQSLTPEQKEVWQDRHHRPRHRMNRGDQGPDRHENCPRHKHD